MKVICDNCRAVYKIPDEKLVKPVNKATCRQCGHRMLIPRPRVDADPDERTLVTAVPPTPAPPPPRSEFNDDPPTNPLARNPAQTVPHGAGVDLHTATPAPSKSQRKTPNQARQSEATQPTMPAKVPHTSGTTTHDPQAICPSHSWVSLWHFSVLCSSRLHPCFHSPHTSRLP